jgi:hypothetical protein
VAAAVDSSVATVVQLEISDMPAERESQQNGTPSGGCQLNIRWDDTNLKSLYSNVCNVTGTREEIILLFGVHQAWQSGVTEVAVQLQDRVILSPYAAKRLSLLLNRAIREYENRYGILPLEAADQGVLSERLPTK